MLGRFFFKSTIKKSCDRPTKQEESALCNITVMELAQDVPLSWSCILTSKTGHFAAKNRLQPDNVPRCVFGPISHVFSKVVLIKPPLLAHVKRFRRYI